MSTDTTMDTAAPYYEDPRIRHFLDNIHSLIIDEALVRGSSRETKVVEFAHPHELHEKLNLSIGDSPESDEKLLDAVRDVIRYSVKTSHPRFFNQLYSGLDPYSLAGSWVTEALNTNMHTFEVAPAFIVLEKYMIQMLCGIIGYKDGNGLFGPGGSFLNFLAINLARYHSNPDVKWSGLFGGKRMMLYASEEAHYSITKGAVFLGFGMDSVVRVKTDKNGRMCPKDLEEKIEADKQAAAWGGGALLSAKYKHLMTGVERSDSVAWNFHKMSGVPLQCSAFLVQEKDILEKCNKVNAEYLFQPDKFYDVSYDIGDKTVQCGRKADVLKLWFMWKANGNKVLGERVDDAWRKAKYLADKLCKTDRFRLVIPEFQCTNVCFWYIPPCLQGKEETPEWWSKVGKVAPLIKEGMIKEGSMMIGYQPLSNKGYVNFFRIIIENPWCSYADLDFVMEEIDRLGKNLEF
ncbi:hypothetical protein CHS0354_022061 [Potamilus streckersoni]|uniref:Glutamate decarboxylase n=1 Tax=Potamilus streckersoni TaxID=2493646 RepID=A0AAE0W034_9BIVA|nr:hypothetical protein CHS0354_022061 [Potamilus streckersoni]